ncbi:MAG: hypothetical protein JSV18_01705 [Candidatus Bathyarchaeota archaeon]|nr:MAG: hypothetical protein JSV18_01705 [Candidatus Bathyarchaeota archaeon]
MGSEEETRKLLRIRENVEGRIGRLEEEIGDLRKAIAEIDRAIVRQGFRQPIPQSARAQPTLDEEERDERISIKSKDGTTLGILKVDETEIVFEPLDSYDFTTTLPPFQSFLIDRVLSNMRATDEGKAARGESSADDVLSFQVSTEGERITGVIIRNYGGERRLREIQSSLRWAFDKMHEKLQR